jgi:hypothetical protein
MSHSIFVRDNSSLLLSPGLFAFKGAVFHFPASRVATIFSRHLWLQNPLVSFQLARQRPAAQKPLPIHESCAPRFCFVTPLLIVPTEKVHIFLGRNLTGFYSDDSLLFSILI